MIKDTQPNSKGPSVLSDSPANSILEAISDGLCIINRDGRFSYVDERASAWLGSSAGLLIDTNLWEHFPGLIGSEFEHKLCKVLDENSSVRMPWPLKVAAGRSLEVRAHLCGEEIALYFFNLNDTRDAISLEREQVRRLHSIIHTVPAFVSYVDREYRYQVISNDYEVHFKRPSKEILGRHVREIIGESAWQQVEPAMQQAMRGEVGTFEGQQDVLCLGNRWSLCVYSPDFDQQGKVQGVVVLVTDITKQKRLETALRESEERVRLAVKAAGIGYWSEEAETGCIALNETCAELFNVGTKSSKSEMFSRIMEEDRGRVSKALQDSFNGARSYETEFRVQAADGSMRWLMGLGGVAQDASGKLNRLYGVNLDISARKEAEEERQRFVSLVKNSSEFIAMSGQDGRPFFMNDAALEMVGLESINEIQQIPIWDLFHPDEKEESRTQLFEQQEFKHGKELETRVIHRKTGEARWTMLNVFPILDAEGKITGLAAVGRDITERKQVEQILTSAARRKDEFLATLAHELRNPLAALSNVFQVWPLLVREPGQLEKVRAMMDRQVNQLKHLIDDLLDVSRISRGKIKLRNGVVDLASVLESAIDSARPLIDAHGHTIHLELPESSVLLDGDVGRLTQIFGNLLNNAAKYSQREGQIRVVVKMLDDAVEICIQDKGLGIPQEMLERIFEPFVQVDGALDRAQGGLGIGLTLVKKLVELHDGRIEARSEGLGKGSDFIVRLPVKVPQFLGVAIEAVPERLELKLPCHRVLVVDDHQGSADTLALMLKELGQEPRVAYDGASALELVKSFRPEVVLSDIAMPGMDGYSLATEIKALDTPAPKLVALTGYGQEQDLIKSHDAGFSRHIVKPTNLAALREILQDA